MYVISKDTKFEAAHHLRRVPEGHKCRTPHGHSYRVRVELGASDLHPELEWVVDYGVLTPLFDMVRARFDHQDLNTVPPFADGVETTAERLAELVATLAHGALRYINGYVPPEGGTDGGWWVHRVGVSETVNTWAWFYPGEVTD